MDTIRKIALRGTLRGAATWFAGLLLVGGVTAASAITVTGTVHDQDGVPMSGALVTITGDGAAVGASAQTGADGMYQLDLLVQTAISVEWASETPTSPTLFQNYPNPFNPGTIIPYQIAEGADVQLLIYNTLGQRIRTLVHGFMPPGVHRVRWDATDDRGQGVGAGLYFYRLTAGDYSQTGKMVLADGSHGAIGAGDAQLVELRTAPPAPKTLAAARFYTIDATGEGFAPYSRTGVAITEDAQIDILVNTDTDMGMVRLGLTDAPVDAADAVRITFSTVQIRRGGNDPSDTFVGDPRTFDLLALTGGISEMMGEEVLPPGELTGVRLIVDSAEIDVADGTFPLFVPSGAETGLKMQGRFEVVPGETLDLTLDFDVRQSVVKRGNENNYLLQPVVRLVETSESGFIAGSMVADEGVTVEEFDAVVIAYQGPDEISSRRVDEVDGTFRLSYLPPGVYDLRVEKGEGLDLAVDRIDGVEVVANEGTEVIFSVTGSAGGHEGGEGDAEGEEGDAEGEEGDDSEQPSGQPLSVDNVGEAWGKALDVLARLIQEAGEAGEASVPGVVEGDAAVVTTVGLSGIQYTITFNAMSDDGELLISGEVVIETSDGEQFTYTGELAFEGEYIGEMTVEASGTVDETTGTLTVGDEELVLE